MESLLFRFSKVLLLSCVATLVYMSSVWGPASQAQEQAGGKAQAPSSPIGQNAIRQMTIHLDPAATKITWVLHSTTHTVNGTFQLKGGLITFNPATGVADGELLVDVATGASGSTTRDNKMKTQVLEPQKYPTAFFHPTLVTGALKEGATQHLTVAGTLNIHGADHPMTLKVDADLTGAAVSAKTSFVVPYVAWGMRDPSVFLFRVAKQVEVSVSATGTVENLP